MKVLLLLLFFPLVPVQAKEPEIQCPGENTIEMRFCASQRWEESNQALKEQLPQADSYKDFQHHVNSCCC